MRFSDFSTKALPKIEGKMKEILSYAGMEQDDTLQQMLRYHMGWAGQESNSPAQGKRIRPLVLLLTTETSGGKWENALAAAASIELIHNFSLIHDDIEDQSDHRRGRLTLWKLHDLPLSLNAGDALFALSFICMGDLQRSNSEKISFQAFQLLSQACLSLTKGQHLDISFENKRKVSVSDYLKMIEGKTASLIATSAKLGALIADSDPSIQEHYYNFGKNLGLAFQIYDDILGIWGDPKQTGKSTASDLMTRKKTLPILYGLSQKNTFKEMWEKEISPEYIPLLASQLKAEGAYDFSAEKAENFTTAALNALYQAQPSGPAAEALEELTQILTKRSS